MPDVIDSFRGEYAFLSNFYPARLSYDGLTWKTSEHAYQAAKAIDPADIKRIVSARTPGEAKRLGRIVACRADWDSVKVRIMAAIVLAKFKQNPDLAKRLLETGDVKLVESNTWRDAFWGVYEGRGQNWLGRILMAVREDLRGGR